MKPERNVLEVDSTLDGEDVLMGIDSSSMGHIMDMLSSVYEDPELAPLRELSTNAYDAHIAAGQDRPIEVEVGRRGSQLSLPVLKIQDWGLGLDEEDIRKIYSQYGASTKRDSNAEVGMFGIGCKSPLAYADQFTVEAVKNGHRIVVLVSRDEDGAGVMTVLDGGATDAPNGVKVEVPVSPGNELLEKAEELFRFWTRGTVLLNGKEPMPVEEYEGAVAITDSISVVPLVDDPVRQDYIVMGNVPYPTQLGFYESQSYGVNNGDNAIIARVGIGGVTIPPSRESLMDTERTRKTLASIKQEFRQAAIGFVEREVQSAASHSEALQAFNTARRALPLKAQPDPQSLTYKGEALPEFDELLSATALSSAGYKYSTGKRKPTLETILNAIWITDYTNEHFTGSQRQKLMAYLEHEKNRNIQAMQRKPLFLTADKQPQHAKWVPTTDLYDWPTIRKWQPPSGTAIARVGAPGKLIRGSYWAHLPNPHPDGGPRYGVSEIAAEKLPQTEHVYWIQTGKYEGQGWFKKVSSYDPDAILVILSTNRVEKFRRDFPKAQSVREAVKKLVQVEVDKLTTDEVASWELHTQAATDVQRVVSHISNPSKLDDPELRRFHALVRTSDSRVDGGSKLNRLFNDARRYGAAWPEPKDEPCITRVPERYPLLGELTSYGAPPEEDLILYVNAAYAARQKEAS